MDRITTKEPASDGPLDFLEFAAARGRHLIRTAFLLTGGDAHSWSVDVLPPDNTRVTVSEFNGTDVDHVVPGTPALTVEQLKAIATGAAWRH